MTVGTELSQLSRTVSDMTFDEAARVMLVELIRGEQARGLRP